MRKPLAIDLFCGLGGWAEGFLAEGYDVVGFDIERHQYGDQKYPAQLVLQDVLTLDGRQFRDAAVIVASQPCQAYSYMAMPWSRAKRKADWYRQSVTRQLELNCLFNACFRISHQAGVALVVENVKGAEPWVGGARWHFGSYYLWGAVPALMPIGRPMKAGGAETSTRSKIPGPKFSTIVNHDGLKTVGHANLRDGHTHTRHLTNERESVGLKGPGGDWFADGRQGQDACADGIKQHLSGPDWFDQGAADFSSAGMSRKAASAQIAKIPFPLAQHIARVFKP